MTLFTKKVAMALFFSVAIQLCLVAQTSNPVKIDSIKVDQVLEKYYAAIGGKEKHKNIKNKLMKFSGKVVIKTSGNTTKMTTKNIIAAKDDGKYLTLIGDEKGLTTKIYYDGSEGYTYLKALGSKTAFTEDLKKIYKPLAKTVLGGIGSAGSGDYLGKVSLDSIKDKAYYVLDNIVEVNNVIYKSKMYFDIETGLLYASFGTGSGVKTESYFLNYTDINGYITPMQQVVYSDLGQGNSSISSNVYEEYNYNGFIDSYFTDDNSVSGQQIMGVPISESKHQAGLAEVGYSIGPSNTIVKTGGGGAASKVTLGNSLRDIAYKEILASKKEATTSTKSTGGNTVKSEGKKARVKDLQEEYKDFKDLKYRRSSLYTIMINDPARERNNIIRNAFGNTELSTKFNDHNIGPYLMPGKGGVKDQTANIEAYLNNNGVAKELVARWFNRDAEGNFNMDLVAQRGQYNASDLDVQIANSSKRGAAILKDAGEELIGNTFVIVYDYKYTNKEESAKKRKGWLKAISSVASLVGADDVANIADGVSVASDVVGKGYFVRTTSYLYRLVWDDETANTFYSEMWVDKDNPDASKKAAFDASNLFKLKYVGSEISRTNLQSTIFTRKNNDQLIEIATTRAVDKNIGKLQRKFEEFRVKTPLLSGDPITAKIGTKEGIEKGDKFEVLEQLIDEDGITSYKRIGVIKVDPKSIWDNAFLAKEQEEAAKNAPKKSQKKKKSMFAAFSKKNKKKKKSKKEEKKSDDKPEEKVAKPEYTIFSGKKGKFASGMLIRQIN